MRLADFIISGLEAILQEWEDFARTLRPAASNMGDIDLRDHAALMLKFIAEDLQTLQSVDEELAKSHGLSGRNAKDSADEHGIGRLESKFTMEQLFSEYRALRASVLRLWRNANLAPSITDIDDVIRFNEAIDQLVAGSVFSFANAQRKAQATEQERRNHFLAMLGHELRNPLAPITMASAILKKAKGNERAVDNAANVIARQATHMAGLIDDLLDVSRVTRGLVAVKLELVDIRAVVDSAVEQVMPMIQAKGHQLEVTGPPRPTIVLADEKRLVQVVTNLLTNAAKYTLAGGHLALQLELHNAHVVITVDDDGVGMPPDFIQHAFELFAQVEPTPDRSTGGLGLGLALVKNLVEMHGGSVACSSAGLGKGSRFTVWLPRQQDGSADVESQYARLV